MIGSHAVRGCLFNGLLAAFSMAGVNAQQARWTAQLRIQIGDIDGPAALSEVFDLEIGPAGEIFVGQPTTGSVLVFSAEGRLLRTIGRRGAGPGEFETVGRLGWIGDSLWVMNFRNLNVFRADGSFVRRITPATLPDLGPGVRMLMPGPVLADGSLMLIPESNPVAVAQGDITAEPIVRVTQAGALRDTLALVSLVGRTINMSIQGRAVRGPHPYADSPLWFNTADGRGLIVVERRVRGAAPPHEFTVIRVGLAGDTIVARRFAYRPVPITAAWRNELYARLSQRYRRPNVTPATIENELREQVDLPTIHTPVTQLVPGQDGTIWLRREDERADVADWWVLDERASLLAVVQLPAALRVMRADRQTVWGVLRDELDVSRIQVYTLRH